MATVIDALILELGLDAKKMTKGQQEQISQLRKFQEQVKKTGDDVEKRAKNMGEFFERVRRNIIGMYAAFTAGKGIKEFIADITSSNAATARFAQQMGISVKTLAEWQGAAKLVGGSASGITSSLQNMTSDIQEFSLYGTSKVLPFLYALGVGFQTANGKMKDASTLWIDIAGAIQAQHISPERATVMLKAMGADEGMIALILQGKDALLQALDAQKQYAETVQADADAAKARQAAWNDFLNTAEEIGTHLLTVLTPNLKVVLGVLKEFTAWAARHPKLIESAFIGISAAVAVLTVALLGLTSPIGLVAIAIGALVGVGTAIYTKWNDIFSWFGDKFNWLGELAKTVFGWIGNAIDKAAGFLDKYILPGPAKKPAPAPSKTPSRPAASAVKPRSDIEKLMGMGWSREQAIGIMANLQRESGGDIHATGDKGAAFGLGQWHPDRQAAFKRLFGHDIRQSTRDEQLQFINWELRNDPTYKKAGAALAGATTAAGAAEIVSKQYERPGDVVGEAALRASIANAMQTSGTGFVGAGSEAVAAASSNTYNNSTTNNSSTHDTKIGAVNVFTQATDAQGIARDIRPAMERNTFAQSANYGAN